MRHDYADEVYLEPIIIGGMEKPGIFYGQCISGINGMAGCQACPTVTCIYQ